MKLNIEFEELSRFRRNLGRENLDPYFKELTEKSAKVFLTNAKRRTPIETGRMRRHWDSDNQNLKVRKIKGGYTVRVQNKAAHTPKEGKKHYYGTDVDLGHMSYNQYGGPYIVHSSKYGRNGSRVIGRFIVSRSGKGMVRTIRKEIPPRLQKMLDRCVENAK